MGNRILSKLVFFTVINLIISFFVFINVGFSQTQKPEATTIKPIVLKYTTPEPATSGPQKYGIEPSLKKLEEASGGRIKIERYWAGSLLATGEEFEGIRSGTADMGRTLMYTQSNLYQLLQLGMLPYASTSNPLNVHKAVTAIIKKGYAADDLKGIKFFASTGTTTYALMFKKKKPMNLEDLAGIKVRDPGGYMGGTLRTVGMIPVSLVPAEVYDGFSKGICEAVYWIRTSLVDYKIYELGKYMLNFDANLFSTVVLIMNEKTFNSLPLDLQNLIEEIWGPYAQEMNLRGIQKGDDLAINAIREKGIEIYSWPKTEMDRVKKAVLPLWEQAIKDMDRRGLPGRKIMTEFVEELKKLGEVPPWNP